MRGTDNGVELLNAVCRLSFSAFCAKALEIVEPGKTFDHGWHIDCLTEHLQSLYEDTLSKRRVCFNVPPRSLKSFICSIAFPAWVLGKDPTKKFICTSYGFSLAKEMSQKSRILIESDWYRQLFPDTVIDNTQNEKHNFWTTKRGFYYSSAVLSCTGRGADYVILDDPINPKEAVSETVRNETNATIRSTLPTRFNDLRVSKWIMIMQRLHPEDPTGHFAEKDDRWLIIKLPGENLTGKKISYTLGKKEWFMNPGDLLFPKRLTREVLNELREDLQEWNYQGQILQEPVPIGGGEFLPQWIMYYHNGAIKPREMNVAILVDPSGGEETNKKRKKLSDYTAMMVVGLANDNNYYLLDVIRDRLNPTDRVNVLFALHRKWNGLCGKPPRVGYEKYGMMTDTHYIEEKQKSDAYNFPLIVLGGAMPKEERIRRLIPDMQNGRWYFPQSLIYVDGEGRRFDLVQEIIKSEMASFPRARFDDMCFVAGTKIKTIDGDKNIEDIKNSDYVLTPDGYKSVIHCGKTGKKKVITNIGLTGTKDHPVYTVDNGYISLDTVTSENEIIGTSSCDWIKIALLKSLSSMEKLSGEWAETENIIYRSKKIRKIGNPLKAFMLLFGNFITEGKPLQALKFITLMVIHSIMILRIFLVYQFLSIGRFFLIIKEKKKEFILKKLGLYLLRGINLKKEECGIGRTLLSQLKKSLSKENIFALNAANHLNHESREKSCFAQVIVETRREKKLIKEKDSKKNVEFVEKYFSDRVENQSIVQNLAQTEEELDVYNLSVSGPKCYFANGVLVHNCDALARIYDSDMGMVFPKPNVRVSMAQKAIAATQKREQDWMDY